METPNKSPAWVPLLLAFITGCATASIVFAPNYMKPDYQRGHADGYAAGWKEAEQFFVFNNGKPKG